MLVRLWPIFIVFLISCASQQGRRPIYESEMNLKGGRFGESEWNDELLFKRVSWYEDATLFYDLLITEVKPSSPFSAWMGTNKLSLQKCHNFYITLLYGSFNRPRGVYHLRQELMNNGLEEVSVLDFSAEMKAHRFIQDWNLWDYKIVGWCQKENKDLKSLDIRVSGQKNYKLSL